MVPGWPTQKVDRREKKVRLGRYNIKEDAKRLPSGKAPGPDMIPNEAVALLIKSKPATMLQVFKGYLSQLTFPKCWKEARLVFLYKGATRFRPLSMLNTVGKVLECILLNRLNRHLDSVEGERSPNQYGFTAGRFTEDALAGVLHIARGQPLVPASTVICAC